MAIPGFYGSCVSMEYLENLQIGPNGVCDCRFRCLHTGQVVRISIQFENDLNSTGYSSGTGGSILWQLCNDNGSGYPNMSSVLWSGTYSPDTRQSTGSIIGSMTVPNVTLTSGNLYHVVLTNTDGSPSSNYISLDTEAHNPTAYAQPWDSNYDCTAFYGGPSSWNLPGAQGIPGYNVYFSDGYIQGTGYCDTNGISGPAVETFIPSATQIVTAVYAGGTGLSFTLAQVGGSTLASGSMTSGPLSDWCYYNFNTPITLQKGTTYNLTVNGSLNRALLKGTAASSYFTPCFTDGNLTSAASVEYALGTSYDMQFYFTVQGGGGGGGGGGGTPLSITAVEHFTAADLVSGLYPVGASCTYSISPLSANFGSASGSGSITVTTQTGCSWVVSNLPPWISITSGASGTGNGTVNYSVSANTGTSTRQAQLSIGGQLFTIIQAGTSGGGGGGVNSINSLLWGFYGTIGSDGNASLPLGTNNSSVVDIRMMMDHTGTLKDVCAFLSTGNYGSGNAGTGGTIQCFVYPDDGSSHYPVTSNPPIAEGIITSAGIQPYCNVFTLTPQISVTAGQLLHFVFVNVDLNPTANYVSAVSVTSTGGGNSPGQPQIPSSKLAIGTKNRTATTFAPAVTVNGGAGSAMAGIYVTLRRQTTANPSFRGVGTYANSGNGVSASSLSFSMPTGTVQNDLMLACINYTQGTPLTLPGGWSLLYNQNFATSGAICIIYKVATSGESGPYTVTVTGGGTSPLKIQAISISGVDVAVWPFDTYGGGSGTATTLTFPTVSVNGVNDMVVLFAANNAGTLAYSGWTGGSLAWTQRFDSSTTGSDATMACATAICGGSNTLDFSTSATWSNPYCPIIEADYTDGYSTGFTWEGEYTNSATTSSETFTVSGAKMQASSVAVRLNTTGATVTITLASGGSTVWTGSATAPAGSKWATATISPAIVLNTGTTYTLTVTGASWDASYKCNNTSGIGGFSASTSFPDGYADAGSNVDYAFYFTVTQPSPGPLSILGSDGLFAATTPSFQLSNIRKYNIQMSESFWFRDITPFSGQGSTIPPAPPVLPPSPPPIAMAPIPNWLLASNMLVRDYVPPFLWDFSLFWPGLATLEFQVDKQNSLLVLSDYPYRWQTGEKVLLSSTGLLPAALSSGVGTIFSVAPTAFDPILNLITTSPYQWDTGIGIAFKDIGNLPTPLEPYVLYFVIEFSATQIRLAASLSDALLGKGIDVTDQGSGNLFQFMIMNPVYYTIVDDVMTSTAIRIATTQANALSKIPVTITDVGSGQHSISYYGRDPSIVDILQYVVDKYGDFSDIISKYGNLYPSADVVDAVIDEQGYGYILDVLKLSPADIRRLMPLIPVIHFLKGSKMGLQLVMRYLGIGYSFVEWWEPNGSGIPDTYTLTVDIPPSVIDQAGFLSTLASFLHQYIYPIPGVVTSGSLRLSLDMINHTYNMPK